VSELVTGRELLVINQLASQPDRQTDGLSLRVSFLAEHLKGETRNRFRCSKVHPQTSCRSSSWGRTVHHRSPSSVCVLLRVGLRWCI